MLRDIRTIDFTVRSSLSSPEQMSFRLVKGLTNLRKLFTRYPPNGPLETEFWQSMNLTGRLIDRYTVTGPGLGIETTDSILYPSGTLYLYPRHYRYFYLHRAQSLLTVPNVRNRRSFHRCSKLRFFRYLLIINAYFVATCRKYFEERVAGDPSLPFS